MFAGLAGGRTPRQSPSEPKTSITTTLMMMMMTTKTTKTLKMMLVWNDGMMFLKNILIVSGFLRYPSLLLTFFASHILFNAFKMVFSFNLSLSSLNSSCCKLESMT